MTVKGKLNGHRKTVLVVEDDPEALRLTSYFLSNLGYRALEASGSAEAVELGREHTGAIDLLLIDLAMPVTSGVELAQRIRAEQCELPVIFLAGSNLGVVAETRATRFLHKPFSQRELATVMRSALEQRDDVSPGRVVVTTLQHE